MTSAHTSSSTSAHRINCIYKHNGWSFLFCFVEKIAYARSAHTHKHFHKFRTRHVEKRHISFSGHSSGQQSFTRTWATNKQYALRNFCPHFSKLFWVFEKIHYFN